MIAIRDPETGYRKLNPNYKERNKMEIKEPQQITLFKTSDNKQFSSLEAAQTREAEIAFEDYYKPFSLIIQETGTVSAEKIQHWLDKYRTEIEYYYILTDTTEV